MDIGLRLNSWDIGLGLGFGIQVLGLGRWDIGFGFGSICLGSPLI